ncbi:hypothetical protein F4801DRAFT_533342 [Xylaria longipes]|nr:hypothetical protein F4801DRAFT_533342 [Xylaria longipes]
MTNARFGQDHCLEALCITIMCHGNTGLYTFAWESAVPDMPTTKSNARSACVKWSSIEEWGCSSQLAESDHVAIPSTWGQPVNEDGM